MLNTKEYLLNCRRFAQITTNILKFLYTICQNNQKCHFLISLKDKEQILILALKQQAIVLFDIILDGKSSRLNNNIILKISITEQFIILYYNDVHFNYYVY